MEAESTRTEIQLSTVLTLLRERPPRVHVAAPTGVWAMAEDALEFIASHVDAHSVTLETGCGASTVVFAWSGSSHRAYFLAEEEGAALIGWLDDVGIDRAGLELVSGSSTLNVPALVSGDPSIDVDMLVIDGCHAFPFPMVDWYYGAKKLRQGGIALVDDVQLPAPRMLADFLDADPRWMRLARTPRWSAFRKMEEWDHDEEWVTQRFYRPPGQRAVEVRAQVERRRSQLRRVAGRIKRRLLRVR